MVSIECFHNHVTFVCELEVFIGITYLNILQGGNERVIMPVVPLHITPVNLVLVTLSFVVLPVNLKIKYGNLKCIYENVPHAFITTLKIVLIKI